MTFDGTSDGKAEGTVLKETLRSLDEGEDDGFALILLLGSVMDSGECIGSELGPSEAALAFCNCNDGFILMLTTFPNMSA